MGTWQDNALIDVDRRIARQEAGLRSATVRPLKPNLSQFQDDVTSPVIRKAIFPLRSESIQHRDWRSQCTTKCRGSGGELTGSTLNVHLRTFLLFPFAVPSLSFKKPPSSNAFRAA